MSNTRLPAAALAQSGACVLAFLAAAAAAFLAPELAARSQLEAPPASTRAPAAAPREAPRFGSLRVRATGEGRATEPGGLEFAKSAWSEARRTWPSGARLVVERAPEERAIDVSPVMAGSQERAGVVAFERLEPGRYVVGLLARDAAWEPRVVLVRPDEWTEVELACTTPPANGTLLVDAALASGARSDALAVRIEDAATGVELLAQEAFAWGASPPATFELPAGRYRVVVEGAASVGYHGTLESERAAGRVEELVTVEPGRATRVEARVPGGARLKLTVHAAIGERERAAFLARFGDQGEWNLDFFTHRATLELCRPGRAPLPADFRYELGTTSAAGTHVRPALTVGTTQVSELLPAGRFTLVARLTSGRSVEREIELVEGATLEVVLAIE
ncbi:MAG: hypothetical protein IPJ77_19605 [Planctomycetes bacterium]|nr:hypothetical protein [Planctomycetota bacterium]